MPAAKCGRAGLWGGGAELHRTRVRDGFTLVELLVVIAIVALLAAFGMAALREVQRNRTILASLSNLRQLGVASSLYSAENQGLLPPSEHEYYSWRLELRPFLGQDHVRMMRSPMDPHPTRKFSYAINDFLIPHPFGAEDVDYSRRTTIPRPEGTLMFTVMARKYAGGDHFHFADPESGFSAAGFSAQAAVDLARGAGHYLFVDGHVESIAWSELQTRLADPQSPFIHPEPRP